ncbi:protein phosphatase 2C domain containing protein [Acanthamoeba castellanii str. Neff]|uniref:Protein phosphatase 2C domain containing protein n=1 Tax=Acanthamoeba castellanii (strain ATCC 30010 / Neff) TaxID=1257118 RepID=L8GQI6_ACACF|nr:protein phosphatase 2C domain containing protein [Acanthamoeba castellanii str. Neff]ELR15142.1 protein phosphatase 2C domain containing protein [Acanthamoeba castellanii str. Neff]
MDGSSSRRKKDAAKVHHPDKDKDKDEEVEDEEEMSREEMLAQLRETRHLDVSKRELASKNLPPELAYMINLEMLSMAQNELTELPKSFGKLSKLVALNLNTNLFAEVPKVLGKLPALSILDMRNNRVTEISPGTLKKMTALTKLMLRYNRIVALPAEVGHLKNLQLLSIRNNHLISVPPELNQLEKLQVFDARGNQLRSIPPLGGLRSLLELDLQHNNLSCLPSELSHLSSLTRLSLGFNNFSEFPLEAVGMSSLAELDLEANCISVVPPDIKHMTALRTLYLSSNKIKSLPSEIGRLSSLEKLSLNHNQLRTLDELKKLVDLDLENNPLEWDKDPAKGAEAVRALSFVPNLKLSAHKTDPAAATRKGGAGGPTGEGSGHRSLFTEGGLMSMFHEHATTTSGGGGGGGNHEREEEEQQQSEEGNGSRTGKAKAKTPREPRGGLIRDFFALEDLNKPGLQKAKKEPLQQEDAHCCHHPFFDENDIALFCELKQQLKAHKKESKKSSRPTDLHKMLHLAYLKADDQMRQFQYEGCTATAVVVWQVGNERYLQCANVGDSAAYLYRAGEPVCLIREHKLTNEFERGRIISSGVWLTDGQTRIAGIGVTRVLGDHFAKDTNSGMLGAPDSSPAYLLTPHDTHLIVASDGLWDVMSPATAGDLVAKEETAEAGAKVLMKRALASAKCKDNVTIVVVRL